MRVKDGRLSSGRPAVLLCSTILVISATNVVPLVRQRYPRDVALDAVRQYGADNLRLETTVLHSDVATEPIFLPFPTGSKARAGAPARCVLLNAKDIWVPEGASESTPPPAGTVLFATPHPRQLSSMQYHGYRPEERAFLRSLDLSIKLIDTQSEPRAIR
jgi:hypothetical protein